MTPLVAGIIRFIMNFAGTWLLAHGVLSQDSWTAASPYVEMILGGAFSLGSLAWNVKTHTASGVGKQLASLKPGPEGQTPPQP